MDTFLLRLHQRQVAHQCLAAQQAMHMANLGLTLGNQSMFWASIQSMLTAAANISKACWGQSGKLIAERAPLRASLEIGDDSPLSNTDLRNHFDHYDERLDRWYAKSDHRHVDFLIGPPDAIVGVPNTNIFRHFDPETGDVIFWGEHYSIPALMGAIGTLRLIAEAESMKPHWDPPPRAGDALKAPDTEN